MTNRRLYALMFLFGLLLVIGIAKDQAGRTVSSRPAVETAPTRVADIQVPPPPFSEDIFPCTECHEDDGEPDTERRKLEAHEEIILKHDEKNHWCLDCHDANKRDFLRLAGGALVPFTESYRLCGQCHGEKYRDWKAGAHGKRTGSWSGRKTYLLCAHCHSPHQPRYPKLKPLPPPIDPAMLRPSLDRPYQPVSIPLGPGALITTTGTLASDAPTTGTDARDASDADDAPTTTGGDADDAPTTGGEAAE